MSLKKNIGWNMLLTLSGYIFPLLTFPYVTRILGAENLGIANYVLSLVDYAVLFSTLGMGIVGVRYISQCGFDKDKRNKVFSSLVSLHLCLSVLMLIIYVSCVICIPSLSEYRLLYFVGASKIILNIFLVEWLFQGMQDFRYVTIRSILTRLLYVIGIFVFVRKHDDYDMFLYITLAQIFANAIINWHYAKRFVLYNFSLNGVREYVFPVFSMGINSILLSFYTTFNVMYLGTVCDTESVGYYTTATKLYGICISVISAYNGVFIPHLNALYAAGEMEKFKESVSRSISLVNLLSLPLITIGVSLAPELILLVAGDGFSRSVLPFQIIMVQVLLVGLAQIFENQILLSFKKFREILICTALSTVFTVIIIVTQTSEYKEIAAALALAIPHVVELVLLIYFVRKLIHIDFSYKKFLLNVLICLPIVPICLLSSNLISNYFVALMLGSFVSIAYYFSVQCFVLKDIFVISFTKKLVERL